MLKITLNMGVGDAKQSTPVLEAATEQLATITGQHPNVRRARKSIANFKLREGMPVGRRRDPARRPHVGVPRPPDLDRDPPDPRLPRAQPALVRRPRQLLARRPRAAHLPRDRLRLDRRGPRPRHHDHYHGRAPTRRRSSCCSGSGCRSPRRGARARSTSRGRGRGGAPQGGGPRAGRGRGRRRSSSSRRRTPRPTPSPSGPRRARKARRLPRAATETSSDDESSEE